MQPKLDSPEADLHDVDAGAPGAKLKALSPSKYLGPENGISSLWGRA
jgi:hypothetical protein